MKRFLFVCIFVLLITGIIVLLIKHNKNDQLLSPIPIEDDVKVIFVTPKN